MHVHTRKPSHCPTARRLCRLNGCRARVPRVSSEFLPWSTRRQLAPLVAPKQSCPDDIESATVARPPSRKCDCRSRRLEKDPPDPQIAPRRMLFFFSAEQVLPVQRWLLGATRNVVAADASRKTYLRGEMNCEVDQARHDGAIVDGEARRMDVARSLGSARLLVGACCR